MLSASALMRGARTAGCLVALLAALAGCAVQTPRLLGAPPADLPPRVELASTPFFPQEDYQCGPAALATALSAIGIPTRPEALVDRVFLPGRQGSLQIEMLAGARGRGAVATRIPGTLEAVMRETHEGNPVVVLQNLGLSWAPSWHYAVVIGYALDAAHFVLRSGPMERQELPFSTFEHTWDRSGRWAFVVTLPGTLPATASETEAARALVAFEHNAPPDAAARAYRGALARWPDNLTLAMGLGNTLYAQGDTSGAVAVFRNAAQRHDAAAAYNNLAMVLLELGRRSEARRAAEQAVSLGGPFREQAADTLRRVNE